MSKGFIYVPTTLTREYEQKKFCNVPTQWGDRLYFGPCKVPMRRKMGAGHWIFGISPANLKPRRIVFAAEIEDAMTFAEAYRRFPKLRGPEGPIVVRPINGQGEFPRCCYEHILGAMHEDRWTNDLATEELDRFFVCRKQDAWRGRWLGKYGVEIDDEILRFLKTCSVHGNRRLLAEQNKDATLEKPIRHGNLFRGLHLETDDAESLLRLCATRMATVTVPHFSKLALPNWRTAGGECGTPKKSRKSLVRKSQKC